MGKAFAAGEPDGHGTKQAAPEQLEPSSVRAVNLRQAVIDNGNVFAVMMDAVRHCSLGQISNALYEVGGQYRRSM